MTRARDAGTVGSCHARRGPRLPNAAPRLPPTRRWIAVAIVQHAMTEVLRRMGLGDFAVHGFRSTFRDWAAERTNFPNDVVEMALAHVVSDKTDAAYRRGDLLEKRRLMAEWATFCNTPRRPRATRSFRCGPAE